MVSEDGDEKGGHDEFDALVGDRQARARKRPKRRTEEPVRLIEGGDIEAVAAEIVRLGIVAGGLERVVFVG